MGYLDDLLGKTIMANGNPLPDRKLLNFRSGVDVTVEDNEQLQATDVFIFGASYVRAFGDVTAAVNIGSGSDDNPLRPPVLTDGSYAAYPFQHIQPAIGALPLHLGGFTLRMDISAGVYDGVNLGGFIGGVLQLIGSWSTPTLASGVTSGTAGAASAGVAVNKPTAAANWTASDLIGLRLVVTGGGGYTGNDALTETVRTIKANTTTQLTLDQPIAGLDATTQFAIRTEGTIINTAAAIEIDGQTTLLGVNYCACEIVLRRIKLDNLGSPADCALITTGSRLIDMGGVNINGDWFGHEVDRMALNACTVGGDADLTNCGLIDVRAYLPAAGHFTLDGFKEVLARLVARGCTNTALRVLHTNYVGREIDAASCTATPFEAINVQYSEPVGNGLTGTNASAPYAAMVTAVGTHMFAGSTMTSATGNQLDFDSFPVSWGALADRNFRRGNVCAIWGDDRWTWLGQQKLLNDSSTPFDDLQLTSAQIEAYLKFYAALRALPTTNVGAGDYSAGAYAEVVPFSGGGQGGAILIGTQMTILRPNAGLPATVANDSVRFFTEPEKPGTGFGTYGQIWNMAGVTIKLFPFTGSRIFFNGVDLGVNAACDLLSTKRYSWVTDRYNNWYVDGP